MHLKGDKNFRKWRSYLLDGLSWLKDEGFSSGVVEGYSRGIEEALRTKSTHHGLVLRYALLFLEGPPEPFPWGGPMDDLREAALPGRYLIRGGDDYLSLLEGKPERVEFFTHELGPECDMVVDYDGAKVVVEFKSVLDSRVSNKARSQLLARMHDCRKPTFYVAVYYALSPQRYIARQDQDFKISPYYSTAFIEEVVWKSVPEEYAIPLCHPRAALN